MLSLHRIAHSVRHWPMLERADWLWDRLRSPYHRLLDFSGRGVRVSIGGCCEARMQAAFCGGNWIAYEPETVAALCRWLRSHPHSLVLDVGCAVGVLAVAALFASPEVEVIAFDSDLASLKATQRMCCCAPGSRLVTVHGFLAEHPTVDGSLADAAVATSARMAASRVSGASGTTRYVCLADADRDDAIPTHSLDRLWDADTAARYAGRPILLKCDVEGAELLVLRGARKLLAEAAPNLLISVHPPALPAYGHQVTDVREYLTSAGYEIEVLAIDHEEHWWCTPSRGGDASQS